MFWNILIAVIGYLIGSINLSIILSKKLIKKDIREMGSGNAGTTNTLRVLGKGPALAVLLFDILKGVIVVLIAKAISTNAVITDPRVFIQLAALAVILGHNFPIYYKFKGGKGVATTLGVLLTMDVKIGLICLVVAVALMAITKYVSLGSVCGAVLYFILTIFMKPEYIFFASAVTLLIIIRHRSNILRLLRGKENKLSFSKKE